ncbi:MAG: hypothetical protein RIN55_08110 [Tissierellaceae bacterium]|nr:hypothetical protein [Tissierellaceae bacterium]
MLTKNAQEFKKFTQSNDMDFEFIETDSGDTIIEFREILKTVGKVRMLVHFAKDDYMVAVAGADFLGGFNPVKKNYLYEVINELNAKYTKC